MGNVMCVPFFAAPALRHKPFPLHANGRHHSHESAPTRPLPHPQSCEIERSDSTPLVSGDDNKPDFDHQVPREEHSKVKSKLGSPFMDLQSELRLAIFEHCTPIPSERRGADTFLVLTKVSRTIRDEAHTACLPRIPVTLRTKKGIRSFRALLQRSRELGRLVRYLWIGTWQYDKEELKWAVDILRAATKLKSFACGEFLLAEAVNAGVLAPACGRLTLMNVERGVEYEARHVAHLRLCVGAYSTQKKFPGVTSLCLNVKRRIAGDGRVKPEDEALNKWVESLERVVMIKRDDKRASRLGLRSRPEVRGDGPGVFSVLLPPRWKEWDIWNADAAGFGVWDMCRKTVETQENGDPEPSNLTESGVSRKRKTHAPGVIDTLRDLPLPVKLEENCDIEQRNNARYRRRVEHRRDPIASPDDASSLASYITIGPDERSLLGHPYVSDMVGDRIPFYLRLEMAVEERAASGANGKDECLGGPGKMEGVAGSSQPRGGRFFEKAHHIVIHNPVMVENNHHPRPSSTA